MSTATAITPDQAAEMFKLATTSATKWAFLDGVAGMCAAQPGVSQKEVVDQIGDTALFISMHGHHRDSGPAARKAASRLKSVRDELAVVKVWAPSDRVDGVSFESHKILNRIGSKAGGKILAGLVKEMGGPGNVTKDAVKAKLAVADPDHTPKANGKTPAAPSGNPVVTAPVDMSVLDLARMLASKLTVGDLSKDSALAAEVLRIADTFEAFSQRNAAKAAAAAAAPAPAASAPVKPAAKKAGAARPSVKRPGVGVKAPAPRQAVKAPVVNVKASTAADVGKGFKARVAAANK